MNREVIASSFYTKSLFEKALISKQSAHVVLGLRAGRSGLTGAILQLSLTYSFNICKDCLEISAFSVTILLITKNIKMKKLTIINGPFLSEFYNALSNKKENTSFEFETKEEGEKEVVPQSLEIIETAEDKRPDVKIKNNECEIIFHSETNEGIMTIF